MLEFEQQFLTGTCPLCSSVPSKYSSYRTTIQERKFVTLAGNPEECICCSCGFKTKTIQLIKQKQMEEQKNGITRQTEQENWNS